MINKVNKNTVRQNRHRRVRNKLKGTSDCPRLCVYRSLTHIYAQIIDDTIGSTLVSTSSAEKEVAEQIKGKNKSEQAFVVGQILAKRALDKKLSTVVFDRGGYLYTGRVKNLAEGARDGGLQF